MSEPEEYTITPRSWWVYPNKHGPSSDFTTSISIDDEGSGEFLLIQQPFASTKLSNGGIAIEPDEWPRLKQAIDEGFKVIKANQRP